MAEVDIQIQVQVIGNKKHFGSGKSEFAVDCSNSFSVSMDDCAEAETNMVDVLKNKIASTLELEKTQFEIIHSGSILCTSQNLDYYGIKDKSKVYVVPKLTSAEELCRKHTEQGTKSELMHLTRSIENVLKDKEMRSGLQPMYRNIVTNIIEAMPVLGSDPAAVGLLHDPQLMHMYGKKKESSERLATIHPLILAAAGLVATHIDIELLNRKDARKKRRQQQQQQQAGEAQTRPSAAASGGSYSLDAMSDTDEEEAAAEQSQPQVIRPYSGSIPAAAAAAAAAAPLQPLFAGITGAGPAAITPQLLASALAAAAAGTSSQPSSSASQSAMTSAAAQNTTTQQITTDMFRSAMASAFATTPINFDSQLQRLRDMGITDEELARRALTATNGDVTAALELIFGDNEF